MLNNPTGDITVDAELKHYCAYSFPGVLQTVGVERWSDLRQVYHTLVQSPNPEVKQTLALSLHEIAKILGMKLAEEELVAVFEEMIQNSETVKMGVIKHLAEFLQLLSMPCRVSYLPLLDDILLATSPFNWRLRQSLASQLSDLVKLPPPQNVYGTLFPLAMTLVQDPVAEVRKESFRGVAKMLRVLEPGYVAVYKTENGTESTEPLSDEEGTQYLNNVARAINALVHGETYHHRQLWAKLSLELLKEMLTGWGPDYPAPWEVEDTALCPWKWLLQRADIRECVERLSKDDKDVVLNMSKVEPLFPEITFEKMKCVGLKRAPGGVVPVGKELMNTPRNKEIGMDDHDDSSSDTSVGGNRSSSSSITSSQGGATPRDESYDEFASEECSSIPPLRTSSPGKAPRRTTPSPNTGKILTSEDILVDEVDFMDKSNGAKGLSVQAALSIPSPLELHGGHVLSDDEEELMTLQTNAPVAPAASESSAKPNDDVTVDHADVTLDLVAPKCTADDNSTSEMSANDK
ncbi:Ppp4r1, partial [Symbiodinium microadriaticum]